MDEAQELMKEQFRITWGRDEGFYSFISSLPGNYLQMAASNALLFLINDPDS